MRRISMFFMFFLLLNCEEIINEQNITNEVVEIMAPVDNTEVLKGKKIAYNWFAVNGATSYQLQVATPTFNEARQIELDTIINTTVFSIDTLDVGLYEWRVKALNSAYETVYTTNGFTVVSEEP